MQSVECLEEFLPKSFLVDSTADKVEALSRWKAEKFCARMLFNHALKAYGFIFLGTFFLQSYVAMYVVI